MIDLKKILTFYQGKLIKVVLEMISKDNDEICLSNTDRYFEIRSFVRT